MRRKERKKWILQYLQENAAIFEDVCTDEFIQSYIHKFHPDCLEYKRTIVPYAPEVDRYLEELYKEGYLCRREREPDEGGKEDSKWVYSYMSGKGAEDGKEQSE